MAESDLWATLRDKMKTVGHFDRVENMVGRGMPDVTYCVQGHEGFIELKQLKEWPARPTTLVKIDHFSPQQRIWIRQRCSAGGRVYVLLEVVRPGPWYGLFAGDWARLNLGLTANTQTVKDFALVTGYGQFPKEQFIQELVYGA